MAGADRDKKEFKNWVRGATGLLYLQEGLQDVVSDKVLQCRDDSVQKLTSSPTVSLNQCNQCTALNLLPEHADLQNGCGKSKGKCKQHNPRNCFGSKPKGRRKCPNGICSKLYDAIVDKHCFEDPLWKNTDPSTWCSDRNGWSFAKCFQTTPSKGTSADTTDAAGLLSILLNNKSIQNWLACKDMKTYTTACPFYKARAIRNEILHSPKFELGEQTLNDYLDAFIKVLQDPKCLISDEGSKQAVAKLKQLQKNQINISWEDETKLFQMHKEALSELDERKFEALQEIDDRKVSVLSAVDSARRDATKEVDDSTKAVLSKVEEVGKEVKEDIEDTAKTALSGVKEAGKGAKQDLEDTTKSALSEIEEAGKGAIQDTEGTTKAALSGIEEAGKEAKQDIEHTTKTALSKIKEAEYDSIKEIRKQKHVVTGPAGAESLPFGETELSYKADAGLHDQEFNQALVRAWDTLLSYMDPDDALAYFAEINLSSIITENQTTRQKNRLILKHTKANGKTGYATLKNFLRGTHQSMLAEILECIENDENTSSLENRVIDETDKRKRLKDLQSNLIEHYRAKYSRTPICPCLEYKDVPLLKVFSPPFPLYSRETDTLKKPSNQGKEQENESSSGIPVNSLYDIFNQNSKECRNIYLTAEPGLGKTSFVKWLALIWCQAHSPVEGDLLKDTYIYMAEMKKYEFVFLIFLRTMKAEDVDTMIENHIKVAFGSRTQIKDGDLQDVLSNRKCLILLDGLDEWVESKSPPERPDIGYCTYLTTSRPWKYCTLSLSPTQIDQYVQIKHITTVCKEKLIPSIFSYFEETNSLRRDISNSKEACQKFRSMLKIKKIKHFYNAPVVLVQLIYMWNQGIDAGNSQCEIYIDMIDTILRVAAEKVPPLENFKNKKPANSAKASFCERYSDLMDPLWTLAFETLFSESKESSLEFKEDVAKQYLTKDKNILAKASQSADEFLITCTKAGLLSRQAFEYKGKEKRYIFSFYHKTIQEFFAAKYIQAKYVDNDHVQEVIMNRCNSVSNILEMGTVFMFLSGLNPSTARDVLRSLQSTMNKNVQTVDEKLAIQNMILSCAKEVADNRHEELCLPLEHIVIAFRLLFDTSLLKTQIKLNSNNIKSLYLTVMLKTNCNVWWDFALHEMPSLCELTVHDHWIHNGSLVQCENDHILYVPYLKTQHLELLTVGLVLPESVTADSLERFFQFVSHQTHLKKCYLTMRNCVHTCKTYPKPPELHLQMNNNLQELQLDDVPVTHLPLNDHLQQLMLLNVPITQLNLNQHLKELVLQNVPVSQLRLNKSLQKFALLNVPLNEHLQEDSTQLTVAISQLELNEQLQKLLLFNVRVSQLQLNERLEHLTLTNVPISQLRLKERLKNLTIVNAPMSKLRRKKYMGLINVAWDLIDSVECSEDWEKHTLKGVPVLDLHLHEYLQELTLNNVIVPKLQLNEHLHQLTLEHVSISQLQNDDQMREDKLQNLYEMQLQLNDNLQSFTMINVTVSKLQLNTRLNKFKLKYFPDEQGHAVQEELPALQLQVNDSLQRLTMENVHLSELHLPDTLQKLTLKNVRVSELEHLQERSQEKAPVSKFQVHLSFLKVCRIDALSAGTALAVFRWLQTAENLHTLECRNLDSPTVVTTLVDTFPLLLHLHIITLHGIDLVESPCVLLKSMEQIENVRIQTCTLASSTLNSLVDTVIQYKQSVEVGLHTVTVKDSQNEDQQDSVNEESSPTFKDDHCSRYSRSKIKLYEVFISSKAFRHFLEIIEKCKRTVAVEIWCLKINENESYREGMELVRTSHSFVISRDSKYEFHFMTRY